MKYKQVFLLLNMSFKLLFANNIYCKNKSFWLNGDGLKTFYYESYGETDHKNEHNIREYYISC